MQHIAERLDAVNRWTGHIVRWLALIMVLVQFVIVLLRYVFGISYIFASESVLYMHAALFMLGAGYTLLIDGHVRVDIFYSRWSTRRRAAVDALGAQLLLIPSMALLAWMTWPFVRNSWSILEGSISVGGIPASFLLKSLLPAFCVLLIIQAAAGLLRDIARVRAPEQPPA
jgi:TRAP-type mannitol/chloroaromatic compound transport system permease small subunit